MNKTTPRHGQGIHHAAYSELVAPVFTPYANGKGNLDVGMKPIEQEEIFHFDCFYPYYIAMKNLMFEKHRGVVYQDINKKKTSPAHKWASLAAWLDLVDIEFPYTGVGTIGQNPNYTSTEWDNSDRSLFQLDRDNRGEDGNTLYKCYYGGRQANLLPSNVTQNYTSKYGLELLTRSIQEDVCILRRREEGWVLIAGSVCFPSHWSLCKKMGKPLDEIHSSVPQINEAISGIITKKMDEMENDKPVERFNWTYSTSGYLTRAGSRIPQRTISEEKVPETFIRVERQTLRKIDNGDIIFTIRTYFHLIEQICRDKDLCSGLLSAILTTPKDVLEYRGMTPHRDVLVKYLEEWDKKHGIEF
jgi:hypothetical protein